MQELDYQKYILNRKEYIKGISIWSGISIILAYAFYHNIFVALVGVLFLPVYLHSMEQKQNIQRLCKLRSEFRDAIQFMEGYLRSGYSVENAMERSRDDIIRMCGTDCYMGIELRYMTGQMRLNVPVEDVWESFARRSGVFQIQQFSCIFRIAKRTGGNISVVIRSSMVQIAEQIRIEEEIRTLLASKTLQMKVMNFVPVCILLYVGYASFDLLQIMYETIIGRVIMTICLFIYVVAYYMGVHMMERIGVKDL